MVWSSSLLVDNGKGSQRVRSPRATNAVGATLRDGYAVRVRLPDDMRGLLARLDGVAPVARITARG